MLYVGLKMKEWQDSNQTRIQVGIMTLAATDSETLFESIVK